MGLRVLPFHKVIVQSSKNGQHLADKATAILFHPLNFHYFRAFVVKHDF